MKSNDPSFTREYVLTRLSYDPETGIFRWVDPRSNRHASGDIAGHVSEAGYLRITLDGKRIMAHRLAWLVHYGAWPSRFVDHRDEDKLNNRIMNLREASKSQNAMNIARRRDNSLGGRGITYRKAQTRKPYMATILSAGKQRLIGSFATVEEAQAAYDAAAIALHGEWASSKRRACH